MKKYKMIEVIGDGTYGTVWKGIHLDTGEKVAIKKLKSKIKSWQECIDLKEVKALSKLKAHQNIIKLKEIIRETNSEVFIVFEYADTNLYEYIENIKKRGEAIPESKIKEIVYQIVNGLFYTHSNGYFHRDLKPENILIMMDKNGEEICVKIADFGLARELPNYYNGGMMTDYVCTRWYRAPECILKSTNYSSPMDIWAVGCIMVELYMLSPLFPGNSEFDQLTKVTNIIGAPKFNEWPEGYKLIQKVGMKFATNSGIHLSNLIPNASMEAINFLYEIFCWDPLRRPNSSKILSHPYFDDIRSKYENTNFTNKFSPYIESHNSNLNSVNSFQNTYYEEYINNFNYKNYRNHNGFIPEMNTTTQNNLSNPFHYNSSTNLIVNLNSNNISNNNNTNNINPKYKLSYMAENDFRFNKFNFNNQKLITNSQPTNLYTNNNYYNHAKNDSYLNTNSNFHYDINSNKQINQQINYSNMPPSDKKIYKSDIENQLLTINGNASYSRNNNFSYFPRIFI